MSTWTLTVGGVEKSLADWGIVANLPFEFQSQANSSVHITTVNALTDAYLWAWDAPVIIQRDRAGSAAAGYSAGSIWFQGFVAQPAKTARGPIENHVYTLYDAWWLLERCAYQMARQSFVGYTIPGNPNTPPIYNTFFDSELTLGEDINENPINTGQQIIDCLNWANRCWNPTRRGNVSGIDPTQDILKIGQIGVAVPIMRTPCRDKKVAEVIRDMLRWSPDAVAWFDYSTTPPTFNAVKAANLANSVINVSDLDFSRFEIRPRYDRQIPGVIIHYKKTIQQDDGLWYSWQNDIYPPALDPFTPDASVHTIELAGSSTSTVKGSLTVATVRAQDGNAALRLEWWQAHNPALNDPTLSNIQVTAANIIDSNGNVVNLAALPNELLEGQVASWMTVGNPSQAVNALRVNVQATVSYSKKKSDAPNGWEQVVNKPIHTRIVVTNGVTGIYSATSHFDPGEATPVGLAQALYDGFSALQYEGQPELVADDIVPAIALGKKLTINTPSETFANILVQAISGELHSGLVSPRLGPPGHVGLTDMIEILRVNRYRLIYNLPSNRSTGAAGSSTEVDLGNLTPKENTLDGATEQSLHTVGADSEAGKAVLIQHDAVGQQIYLYQINKSDGSVDATAGSVNMWLQDCEGEALDIGRVHFTDSKDGNTKRFLACHSPPVADDPNNPSGNTVNDIWLGGGSGSVQLYTLVSVQDNYLTCQNGAVPPQTFYIAKAPECRNPASELINGVGVTYGYSTTEKRTATINSGPSIGVSEIQIIIPRYTPGFPVTIAATAAQNGTGLLDPNGKAITLVDLNWAGRAWARKYLQS